ncbi:uncharacterized protein LOC124676531 [Lolium rigidum]|uniref:uncharacterized protein LOC124676531 n=1 Tax=Lolium rigidum TaxID=89674 RepID=UPI001F5C41BC|nr:uncharacterized protein LOC124676531 [Lolium rigidum]
MSENVSRRLQEKVMEMAFQRVDAQRQTSYESVPKFPVPADRNIHPWLPHNQVLLDRMNLENAWLPHDATRTQLSDLYKQIHQRYLSIKTTSFSGNVMRLGQYQLGDVPVTPPGSETETTYHTIMLRAKGGQRVELLIREFDNYVIAWRVIRDDADFLTARWFAFKDTAKQIPRHLFGDVIQTLYSSGYSDMTGRALNTGISVGIQTLEEITDFLVEFDVNQGISIEGIRLFQTLFVIVGEAQRLGPLQNYVLDYINVDDVVNIDEDHIDEDNIGEHEDHIDEDNVGEHEDHIDEDNVGEHEEHIDDDNIGEDDVDVFFRQDLPYGYDDVIHNWSSVCDAIYLLSLVICEIQLEQRVKARIGGGKLSQNSVILKVRDQILEHKTKTEKKLVNLESKVGCVLHIPREEDGTFGQATVDALIGQQVYLLKYNALLVPKLMARLDNPEFMGVVLGS